MTFRTKQGLIDNFLGVDPADFVADMARSIGDGQCLCAAITYASATQTLGTVPANSVVTDVFVIRTTAWDAITTFEVGKSGDTNWLCTTAQANVDGAITAGEQGEMETVAIPKVVTADTAIILTLNQGAASAGAGYVLVRYMELTR